MLQPSVPQSFLKELHLVRNDIFPIWNKSTNRFEIWHKDRRTGLIRVVLIVQEENGDYRPLDNRTVLYLAERIAWDLLDKYPTPQDMGDYFINRDKSRMEKAQIERVEFLNKWNKENESRWKQALELAQRGILSVKDKKDKKVFSYHNFKKKEGENNAVLQPNGKPYRADSTRSGISV